MTIPYRFYYKDGTTNVLWSDSPITAFAESKGLTREPCDYEDVVNATDEIFSWERGTKQTLVYVNGRWWERDEAPEPIVCERPEQGPYAVAEAVGMLAFEIFKKLC